MQNCDQIEHIFLSTDAETWDPYSESYSINEDQLVDAGREIVYTTPRSRTVFEPMEVEEISGIPYNKAPPAFVPAHRDFVEPLDIG